MAAPIQSRGRRRWRSFLRAVRISLLLLVFFVVAAGVYLNEVGLPGFLKRPLLARLRARGVDLQFTRLRLRWHRGLVAENVRFGGANPDADADAGAPRFTAREAELQLNHAALAGFTFKVDSLVLNDGQFVWPLEETNQPPLRLAANGIQTRLRFLTNDEWQLDQFTAAFAGARLRLTGSVTNASALRDWEIFRASGRPRPGAMRAHLRDLARAIDRIKFAGEPELAVDLSGDARDPQSFHGLLTLRAPGADTPWGMMSHGVLTTRLSAPNAATNRPQVQLELQADQAVTRWAGARDLRLSLHVLSDETMTNPVQARMEISADMIQTEHARAATARFEAQWSHSLTNPVPLAGTGELRLTEFVTSRGSAGAVRLDARLNAPVAGGVPRANEQWAWWALLEPYSLDWDCRLNDIKAEDPQAGVFVLSEAACGGQWRAPELTVTNLYAELYGGHVDVRAVLDVATRAVTFDGTTDFDVQKLAPLLTPNGRQWLGQYSWEKPPLAHGTGGVVLPAWTNPAPDWHEEVLPTLWLRGDFMAGNAAYRGVPLTSAGGHFSHSNMVWHLPDLVATRPEGSVTLVHDSDERSQLYYFRVHSTIDVVALRELLAPGAQRALDFFEFTQPPVVDADVWGRWHHPTETGFNARMTMSNFTFRGEPVSRVQAGIQYTNEFVQVTEPRIERGSNYMTADGVGVDIAGQKIFLTNGFSTMETLPVMHALGSKIARDMEPYKFLRAPTVRANGVIPLADEVNADLHFQVDGGPFNWLRFNLEHIAGGIDWVGDRVSLTNMTGDFYGGQMAGRAVFDFRSGKEADFAFNLDVTNTDLRALMADISDATNHLEGRLSGNLHVSRANSHDLWSWFGDGHVNLREGLIWEIPVFGLFSPVLDSISPGLGKSRASEGTGTFTITNSVIRSDNLEIRSPAMFMTYKGTVGFDSKVDAVVEAKLLRQTPLLGPFLSVALLPLTKLFEYNVTGTLAEPKSEPRYVLPKLLAIPFTPFEALKEIMPGSKTNTYAPPVIKPEKDPDKDK